MQKFQEENCFKFNFIKLNINKYYIFISFLLISKNTIKNN